VDDNNRESSSAHAIKQCLTDNVLSSPAGFSAENAFLHRYQKEKIGVISRRTIVCLIIFGALVAVGIVESRFRPELGRVLSYASAWSQLASEIDSCSRRVEELAAELSRLRATYKIVDADPEKSSAEVSTDSQSVSDGSLPKSLVVNEYCELKARYLKEREILKAGKRKLVKETLWALKSLITDKRIPQPVE
jgi:hypothetical protein